jgi:DNA-binding NarL/FixJ family response regulator
LLSRALALLAVDRADEATALRDEALQSGRSRKAQEVQSLARWVDAIIAMREGDNARLVSALRDAIKTGMLDSFVVTYRSFPEVLELLVADSEGSALVVPILNRIGDHHQARAAGLSNEDTPTSTLTPREREVYELLAAGRTNREIATALFISEVTVKVHVRHILQKLGARTRTEAVFRGARQMLPY